MLAPKFTPQDFNLVIRHSHTALSDEDRKAYIAGLKEKFQGKDFDLVLYDYYRRNGKSAGSDYFCQAWWSSCWRRGASGWKTS